MPSISTHVLNSENGTHVAGLTVTLTHIKPDGAKKNIFSNKTNDLLCARRPASIFF